MNSSMGGGITGDPFRDQTVLEDDTINTTITAGNGKGEGERGGCVVMSLQSTKYKD